MTEIPPDTANPSLEAAEGLAHAEELLLMLRRKEKNWVEWGKACQALQKSGYNSQKIFEATGFEPIHQNQVIVAAQVYTSLLAAGVSEEVRSHYTRSGSDSLYELRILAQAERATAAELLVAKKLDSEGAREVAKALKEVSLLRSLPQGFTKDAGDILAYYYWKLAKQKNDLAERSRLIARALMFVQSPTARQQVEQLLLDFSQAPKRPVPKLPVYRLEIEDEMPRTVPVAGKFPLTAADLQAVPTFQAQGRFQLVQISWQGNWTALPGWQVVLKAEHPIAIICQISDLPGQPSTTADEVLLLIDGAINTWDVNSYFIVEQAGQLQVQWFEEEPNLPLLGKLVLVMRPKKIVDEEIAKDVWQIDE